jgi:hypothetical protein
MPNRLSETTVRVDWREIDRQSTARGARVWRWAQVAIVLAVLASVLLDLLAPRWPALQMVRMAIFTLVTWAPPLWYLIYQKRGRQRAPLALARVLALLTAATAIAALTAPAAGPGAVTSSSRLPLPFVLLVPAATWALLLYQRRQAPAAARALGFVRGDWVYYALAGAAAGVALGFHMLLITHYLPFVSTVHRASPSELFWLACYVLGLRATGEELLFRGLGFHLLSGGATAFPSIMVRITMLNLLLYLIPLSYTVRPALWLLSLGYGILLSVATTLFRYRSGTLVPALACNAVFTLFVAAVLPW